MLFLALTMMALFDDEISGVDRRIIFLIFMLSVVVSYYTYSYEFFFMIATSWILLTIIKIKDGVRFKEGITPTIIALAAAVIFFWYSQMTASSFNDLVGFVDGAIRSQMQAFVAESRAELGQKAFGRGLEGAPEIMNFIIYYFSLGIVAIGSMDLMRKYKTSKFGREYTSMVIACLFIWAIIIITPYMSQSFGLERGYYPTLIILAPCLIIGANFISNLPSLKKRGDNLYPSTGNFRSKLALLIVIVIIASQLMVNTGITYQMFGEPRSVFLNSEGLQYDIWYVHIQEVTSAKWLCSYTDYDIPIHTDIYQGKKAFTPLQDDLARIKLNTYFFKNNKSVDTGYIYLGYQNVVDKTITPFLFRKTKTRCVPLANYSHLFVGRSKIYDNGGSEVWG